MAVVADLGQLSMLTWQSAQNSTCVDCDSGRVVASGEDQRCADVPTSADVARSSARKAKK
jgi:hypothetical protein